MEKYRVVLVEDDTSILERLSTLVNDCEWLELDSACCRFQQGLAALLEHKPDILLTDLGLPDGNGIDLIKAIREHNLDSQALVISGFQDDHHVFQALEAGANGYILKHDSSANIIDSLQSMVDGGAPMSPVIARLMLQRFMQRKNQTSPQEELTERQLRILKLVSQGFSSREIAEKLDISYYTVTTHIKNIYSKLQVNSRSEAIHEAYKLGLIDPK